MTKVEQIEKEVESLAPEELAAFRAWSQSTTGKCGIVSWNRMSLRESSIDLPLKLSLSTSGVKRRSCESPRHEALLAQL